MVKGLDINFKLIVPFLLLAVIGINGNAQKLAIAQSDSARLSSIVIKLEKFSAAQPTEKVYLHFNKPTYSLGDTIWFKGYLTVGAHHLPSALSGILYVEMIDGNNKVIKSLMLKVANGVTLGNIAISEGLVAGDYRVRAYTNWMRNAGSEYFFSKTIAIGSVKSNAVFVTSSFDVNKTGDVVNTQLAYTDKLGRAYDHKEVTYELRSDTNLVVKGKGITDDKGILHLAFADKVLPKQQLITHVKLLKGIVVDKTIPVNLQNGSVDLQFFPEGGQLVTGVRSKVAFKAIGINGLGVGVSGVVTDNDHNEVAVFSSQHAGMGVFAFTPQEGKTYSAKVTLADSSVVSLNLPAAVAKGFVLSVNNTDSSKLSVRIASNEATLSGRQHESFFLVAQAGGIVYYTTSGKLDNAAFTAIVPKSKFPAGIVQFTLFSNTMEPLNERVVFVENSKDLLNLSLAAPKPVYASGEKMSMDFESMLGNSKPVAGSFSVSVFNEAQNTVNENAESTILSNLLLTSDLKGYVEEPNYYFNKPNGQSRADLDVLMFTQGYRRFDWKQVMTGNLQTLNFQPERSLNISGLLTTPAGKPVANGKVTVISALDNVAIDTVSDAEGHFSFKSIEFPDSTKLVIQARKANDGKNVNILMDNGRTIPIIFKPNVADVSVNLLPPVHIEAVDNGNKINKAFAVQKADTVQIGAAVRASIKNQLNEITINEKKINKPDQSNLWGTVPPEKIITGDQMRDYAMSYMGLVAHVPNVLIRDGHLYDASPAIVLKVNNEKKLLAVKAISVQKLLDDSPIPILLNGSLLRYDDDIDAMVTADNIEDVKILRGNEFKSIYGIPFDNPNDRVILITTKQFAGTDTAKMEQVKINNVTKNVNLKQIDIKARNNAGTEIAPWKTKVPNSSNLNGPGMADQVISGDELHNCIQLIDCLQAKIPSIIVKDGKYYFASHLAQSVSYPSPIRFVVDGLFGETADILDNIIIDNIQAIEVLKSSSYLNLYGENASGGLLIVTTKVGNAGINGVFASKDAPGVIYTRFNGFEKAKQFYIPKYTYTGAAQATTDTRTAVYWNPNITTDNTGKCTLEFYNSSVKGTYRAVVEGIDNDGHIGRYVYRYKVE